MTIKKYFVAILSAALLVCAQSGSAENDASLMRPACQMPIITPKPEDDQLTFGLYSWQVFIAANWPASQLYRGEPDCEKLITDTGPRVWQTYKTSNEVFLRDAKNPGSWNDGYEAGAAVKVEQAAKATNNTVIEAHMEAVGKWLIDQKGNPTYFQMLVNKPWYDYVVNNNFYDRNNFSESTRINLPIQSMEVKAAWRIMTDFDDRSRYITQKSTVVNFDSNAKPKGTSDVVLGLVGLHLTIKAVGFPQWIWATFEHVDNVPDSIYDASTNKVVSQPKVGVNYSYYNASATKVNQSPCLLSDPNDCLPFTTPNPLSRLTPIRSGAVSANQQYQNGPIVKGSVLENYQLVATQWPSMPNNPSVTNGMPTPTISANTSMESYIQSSSSCMNCHGMAKLPGLQVKSDYSYLFNQANNASTNQ